MYLIAQICNPYLFHFREKSNSTLTFDKRDNTAIEIDITEEFTYDHAERLTLHTHKTGNEPVQILTRNNYDDIGQLVNKKVGGNQANGNDRWQDIDYKYNIRGWLTDINDIDEPLNGAGVIPPSHYDELFAFRIIYDGKPIVGSESDAPPLFNGNIGHTYWKTGSDNTVRGYHYFYDQMNRLRRVDFHIDGDPYNEAYKEMLAYDLNGNITKLFRNVGDAMDNAIDMDILEYFYEDGNGNSNRLINVTDTSSSDDMNGFIDGNNHASTGLDDYEYDDNGNMIKDRNKGIQSITYNYLNLPTEIYWDNEHKITYLYNVHPVK